MAQYFGSVPFSVGELVTVTDPNDAATPTKRAVVPSVTIATASGGTAFGSGTSANQVQGTSASGAADDGSNPVKAGGRVTTTGMTYSDGQRADVQMDANGAIAVYLKAPGVNSPISAPGGPPDNEAAARYGYTIYARNQYFNGTGWDRTRGDATGSWSHTPPSTATSNSNTIAASGGTATVTFTNTSDTEVFNPSTSTLWASWGTPAVNGAGSFPIIANGSYRPPSRVAGTLTLLSTAANQPFTSYRYA